MAKARAANAQKAEGDKKVSSDLTMVVDNNIAEFCDISKNRQRSLGEKEQDFLMALQSFYDTGAPPALRARLLPARRRRGATRERRNACLSASLQP